MADGDISRNNKYAYIRDMKISLLLSCLFVYTGAVSQTVSLKVRHEVDGKPMVLRKQLYTNTAGDTFNITVFRYYLSNFSFTTADGQQVPLPPAYYLVSEDSAASKNLILSGLPAGHYTAVSFMIGVDSIMNCSGAQEGAVDVIYGLFWTWNIGYIMAKLEGTSPSSKLPNHMIEFHIGGYRAPYQSQRMVILPVNVEVGAGKKPVITLSADAGKWFGGISFRETPGFMTPGTTACRIADNYQHMFSVKKVTNCWLKRRHIYCWCFAYGCCASASWGDLIPA